MTKEDGFISIYRKFLSWEWFDDERSVKIFIYLLLKANWKRKRWRGQWVERGQFITSTVKLAADLNMNRTTVIRNLKRFQESGEITIKADSQKSVITISKYEDYQIKNEEVEQPKQQRKPQREQQRTDSKSNSEGNSKSNTTNKDNKENKENKDNKVKGKPSYLDFSNFLKGHLIEKKIKASDPQILEIAENFFNFYNSNGWKIGKNQMKDWQAAARNCLKWEKNEIVLKIQTQGAATKTATGVKFPDYYNAEFVRRYCQDADTWQRYEKHLKSLGLEPVKGGQGTTWRKKQTN